MQASHQKAEALRIELADDVIKNLSTIDPISGQTLKSIDSVSLYPNSHHIADRNNMRQIISDILSDLGIRLRELKALGKTIEYQRLEQRVMQDVEMFEQLGWCVGVENYSRYLTGKAPGQPPPCLLDYFPDDYLIMLDESHLTVPQISGMYRGDRARKMNLVEFGFRLPSALDNRPLSFDEFLQRADKILYISATPAPYELTASGDQISEQVIRPTGLIDPPIEVHSARNQVDDLLAEIKRTIQAGYRVLVTTLTKKMAEDLSSYFSGLDLKTNYLHADIDSLERVELLRQLRRGDIDVLIGINLLREGLDLPEVGLVAVMDADKEGFLRSKASLIQIVGRAARNREGRVIFYADQMTASMQACIDETNRRRSIQVSYNSEHGITPESIRKEMPKSLREIYGIAEEENTLDLTGQQPLVDHFLEMKKKYKIKSESDLDKIIRRKTKQMQKFAENLEFEKAADLRDEVTILERFLLEWAGLSDP